MSYVKKNISKDQQDTRINIADCSAFIAFFLLRQFLCACARVCVRVNVCVRARSCVSCLRCYRFPGGYMLVYLGKPTAL